MIRALFKFAKIPERVNNLKPMVVDTTANSGPYCWLSPFLLSAPPANRFENLWQFSKVYKQHLGEDGLPNEDWWKWRDWGFMQVQAHRYPMGKGAIPEYSYWHNEKLDYILARKKIYVPIYAENVKKTPSYFRLETLYTTCCKEGRELILLDYDAPRGFEGSIPTVKAINDPQHKMGHAFVLIMMLTDTLEDCTAV